MTPAIFRYCFNVVTYSILQTQTTQQSRLRVYDILTNVWKKEKWRGMFAGNGANCVRVLPFSALVCLAYYNMAKVQVQKYIATYILVNSICTVLYRNFL